MSSFRRATGLHVPVAAEMALSYGSTGLLSPRVRNCLPTVALFLSCNDFIRKVTSLNLFLYMVSERVTAMTPTHLSLVVAIHKLGILHMLMLMKCCGQN